MTYDLAMPAMALIPALGAALAARAEGPRAPRRWAIGTAALTLGLACALLVHTLSARRPELALDPSWGGAWLRFESDGASAVLAVVAALVHAGALAFTPRRVLDARLAGVVLLGEAGTMLALFSPSSPLFLAGWAIGMTPLLSSRTGGGASRLARLATAISVCALAGALLAESRSESAGVAWIGWLIAAVARAGVPPLHGWAPVAIHRAPVAAAVPVVMSPLPLLALARSMEAGAEAGADVAPWLATSLVVLGTAGAVYGALLAMVQHELRRALGYAHVSVVATLVAGIGTATEAGLTGALLGSVSAALALSGLVFLASAIGARTGTCDMRRLGGLHARMPLGGAIFLLCGLAVVGLPGTIGFVSEDLVMQGLVPGHPVVAIVVLAAAALNAVTLFRCYKRTFLGPPSPHGEPPERVEDLLARERSTSIVWAALLVAGGFVPAPLIAIQSAFAHEPPPAAAPHVSDLPRPP